MSDNEKPAIKVVLGARPKSVKHVIRFELPEGGLGMIPVEYRYFTRSDFGKLADELMEKARVALSGSTEADIAFSLHRTMERLTAENVDYLQRILVGWGLDAPFNTESMAQLSNELPAAAMAIMADCKKLMMEGRRGN